MKPLKVYLTAEDLRRLSAWAARKGWTKSHAARVAIRTLVNERDREDAFLASSGMIVGLPTDLSENLDSYLNETCS